MQAIERFVIVATRTNQLFATPHRWVGHPIGALWFRTQEEAILRMIREVPPDVPIAHVAPLDPTADHVL